MNRMPNGAKYAISTGLAAAAAITAISNTDPAVASAAAPPVEGGIVLLSSGWPELDQAAFRAGTVVPGTSFEIEGFDASDATQFLAGEGVGTFQTVSGFQVIDQVIGIENTGGEQNYETYQYAQDGDGKQREDKTFKGVRRLTLTMHADEDKGWHAVLTAADKSEELVVVREVLKSGKVNYYAGSLSYNGVPVRGLNKSDEVKAILSLKSLPTRYAAV